MMGAVRGWGRDGEGERALRRIGGLDERRRGRAGAQAWQNFRELVWETAPGFLQVLLPSTSRGGEKEGEGGSEGGRSRS